MICQIDAVVDYYSNVRYRESIDNVTLADVHLGRDKAIIRKGKRSRNRHIRNAAYNIKSRLHKQSHRRTEASNTQTGLMSQLI